VSGSNGSTSSRAQMLAELRGAERFLLATHENPDGDALGSLAGMQLVLADRPQRLTTRGGRAVGAGHQAWSSVSSSWLIRMPRSGVSS